MADDTSCNGTCRRAGGCARELPAQPTSTDTVHAASPRIVTTIQHPLSLADAEHADGLAETDAPAGGVLRRAPIFRRCRVDRGAQRTVGAAVSHIHRRVAPATIRTTKSTAHTAGLRAAPLVTSGEPPKLL